MDWQEHIISGPQVLLGKPTIKGTRISVELILELFSLGWTKQQILESYPSINQCKGFEHNRIPQKLINILFYFSVN